jgi:hypothetical protein
MISKNESTGRMTHRPGLVILLAAFAAGLSNCSDTTVITPGDKACDTFDRFGNYVEEVTAEQAQPDAYYSLTLDWVYRIVFTPLPDGTGQGGYVLYRNNDTRDQLIFLTQDVDVEVFAGNTRVPLEELPVAEKCDPFARKYRVKLDQADHHIRFINRGAPVASTGIILEIDEDEVEVDAVTSATH